MIFAARLELTNYAPAPSIIVMTEIERLEAKPKRAKPPGKPTGSAGMTPEERIAATETAKAEWKAKHGDKLPKVH